MPPLYALTQNTADRLKRILADGGEIGGQAHRHAIARGVTWVKVTSAPDGVVSIDQGGTFIDLETPVEIFDSEGNTSTLTGGKRYPCTRTGDVDGVAQFRVIGPRPPAFGFGVLGSPFTIGSEATWLETGLSVEIPAAGWYLIFGNARAAGETTGSAGGAYVRTRLVADTAGVLDHMERVPFQIDPGDVSGFGESTFIAPKLFAGADTVNLEARREANGSTWLSSPIVAGTSSQSPTSLGFLRIT